MNPLMNPLSLRLLVAIALATSVATTRADLLGVDVSTFQGTVNWNSMKSAGVEFGFAKATEGVDFTDTRFVQNMNGARAAGVPIGPYHYGRPDSFEGTLADPVKIDAINEANDFVDAIEPFYNDYPGAYLRPVLDVEELPSTAEINTVSEQRSYLSDWINDFASVVVDRLGVEPIIYLNANYANNYVDSTIADYDLWIARWTYNTNNRPTNANLGAWDDWDFWQWSDSESIGGESPVDANLFRGTVNDLQAFVVGGPTTVAGDFNSDGLVNAADYTVWRDSYLTYDPGNPADANGNNFIGLGDRQIWADNYGAVAAAATAVPEPSTAVLLGTLLTLAAGRAACRENAAS